MIVSCAESAHENQVCELCDKYVTLAIDYLQEDDNQKAIVEALHLSCSQIPPLKKQVFIGFFSFFSFFLLLCDISAHFASPYVFWLMQCLSMVDHYTQLFFTQISEIKSDQICKKLNLCQAMTKAALASQVHQGNCEACRETVSEVITKLKDPETKVCTYSIT